MDRYRLPLIICALAFLAETTSATVLLVNGDFSTGDFTGWTQYNTPYGESTSTQVVQFDTAGTGTPTYAAQFEVGQSSDGTGEQGAGIYQTVQLSAGTFNFSAFIAATGTTQQNLDAGTFQLLLNGTVVATDSLGGIYPDQTIRSTLDYTGTVSAGTYQVTIQMLRDYHTVTPVTPYQYISDAQLTLTPVPEPPTTIIGGAALLGVLAFRRILSRRTAALQPR